MLVALLVPAAASAQSTSKTVAKKAENATLGKTILTTTKGRPLYSFGGDTKSGQVNGEGIKDVGTWHAAAIAKLAPQPEPEPQPNPYPNPYPY